jgi:nitroreductase
VDAYDAVISKRDRRTYRDEPVADEELRKVLQAARMAGSAKNAQLTRLVVVTDDEQRRRLTECGDFTSWIDQAPVVIVLAIPVDDGRLFDVGRMAQNVMVVANSLGLATCPVTFHHQDRLRAVLGLPETIEARHGITLGRPTAGEEPNPLRAPRVPLDELVHRDRW